MAVAVAAALWSAGSLSAVAIGEDTEFMIGMDDEVNIRRLQDTQDLPLIDALWAAAMPAEPAVSLGVYEPGTSLFRTMLARTVGQDARTFAIAGLFLHCLAVALAFGNSQVLLSHATTSPLWIGMASAYIGSHAMRVEVVCWSSCHGYLLATIFCLLSFRCRTMSSDVGELFFLGCAFLCKAAVVTFVTFLWVWDILEAEESGNAKAGSAKAMDVLLRTFRRIRLRFIPLVLVEVILATLASSGAPADVRELDLLESLLRAAYAPCFYLYHSLVPPWQWTTPRFALPAQTLSAAEPRFVAALTLLCTLTLGPPVLWLCRVQTWKLWLAWLTYLSLLLPTLGVSNHVWSMAADRYVYLPSLCLFIPCLANFLHRSQAAVGRKLVLALWLPFLLASSWHGYQVAAKWAHGSTFLFKAILEHHELEFHTLKDLGTLQLKQGHLGAAKVTLNQALELRPSHPGVLLNMATLLHKSKVPGEAEEMYRRACAAATAASERCQHCQPAVTELAKAQANYGGLLLQLGRANEAAALLEVGAPWEEAVESARAVALQHLCIAYHAMGPSHKSRAIRFCRAASAAKGVQASDEDVQVNGLR